MNGERKREEKIGVCRRDRKEERYMKRVGKIKTWKEKEKKQRREKNRKMRKKKQREKGRKREKKERGGG